MAKLTRPGWPANATINPQQLTQAAMLSNSPSSWSKVAALALGLALTPSCKSATTQEETLPCNLQHREPERDPADDIRSACNAKCHPLFILKMRPEKSEEECYEECVEEGNRP
jgi:hypothetical protein